MTPLTTTLKKRIDSYNWTRISWLIAIEFSMVIVGATLFLPGGDDLYRYYLPFAQGCLECGYTPYFSQWFLWPLQFVPLQLLWPLWTAVTLIGALLLCRQTGANPVLLLLTFPLHAQLWLGQIDILVCLGLALLLLGKIPYARGAGVVLAMIKPQYAALAVLIMLTRDKQLLKTLIVPVLFFGVSLAVFGITWPIEWIRHSITNLPPHHWRLAAADIWPLGVLLLWVPFLFKDRRARFETGVIVSVLSSPVVGVYSYIIFLFFSAKKWWIFPLSYVWIIVDPFLGPEAMRFGWTLPLSMLLYLVFIQYKQDLPTGWLRGRLSQNQKG